MIHIRIFPILIILFISSPVWGQHCLESLNEGDILALVSSEGVYKINPVTGVRCVFSDFGDTNQGASLVYATGLAVEADGNLLVVDRKNSSNTAAIYRINSLTGSRSIVSHFGDANDGPLGFWPYRLTVESNGFILVASSQAGQPSRGALLRINPVSGVRSLLSDFGDPSQGPLGGISLWDIEVDAGGSIYAVDIETGNGGVLFQVDPITGFRTVLVEFVNGCGGSLVFDPHSVAVEAAGSILVSDLTGGLDYHGSVLRIGDPFSVECSLLSDWGDPDHGQVVNNSLPLGLAVDGAGAIWVLTGNSGTNLYGELYSVHPQTGHHGSALSDLGDSSQGPIGCCGHDVVVYGLGGGVCTMDSDCNDVNVCNGVETCDAGVCEVDPGTVPNCNDNNVCTTDACDNASGCAHTAVNCADTIACTMDSCDAAAGCQHAPNHAACTDDGFTCTIETCDSTLGCTRTPNHEFCKSVTGRPRATCNPSSKKKNLVTGCV